MDSLIASLYDLARIVVYAVAVIAVPVLTTLFVRYARLKWKLDITEKQRDALESLAEGIVMEVEDKIPGTGKGKEKLGQAMLHLVQAGAKVGIKVTPAMARVAIERALKWTVNILRK